MDGRWIWAKGQIGDHHVLYTGRGPSDTWVRGGEECEYMESNKFPRPPSCEPDSRALIRKRIVTGCGIEHVRAKVVHPV